jgi:hypothetical protein
VQQTKVDAQVRFYGIHLPGNLTFMAPLWWAYLLTHKVEYRHCSIELANGMVFDCNSRWGCFLSHADIEQTEPTSIIPIQVESPDLGWWVNHRRFTPIRSFLHTTGLIGRNRVVNCATAAARFLGIQANIRTPDDLYRELSNVGSEAECVRQTAASGRGCVSPREGVVKGC